MTLTEQQNLQNKLSGNSSLKALQILSAMAYYRKECGIQELASLTSLPMSTVHRIMQELSECGLAVKENSKYRIGTMARVLFSSLSTSDFIVDAASLEMTRLNDLTLETVHLIAKENMEAVYIAKKEAKNQIGLRSSVGKRVPLYCTSGGKLLLAYQPQEWIDLYLNTVPLLRLTENTITDRQRLLSELEIIRKQGYALDNSEHNPEVSCVSAPIFYPDGQIAATIGVSTPKYRIDNERTEKFLRETIISAAAVTEKLRVL